MAMAVIKAAMGVMEQAITGAMMLMEAILLHTTITHKITDTGEDNMGEDMVDMVRYYYNDLLLLNGMMCSSRARITISRPVRMGTEAIPSMALV